MKYTHYILISIWNIRESRHDVSRLWTHSASGNDIAANFSLRDGSMSNLPVSFSLIWSLVPPPFPSSHTSLVRNGPNTWVMSHSNVEIHANVWSSYRFQRWEWWGDNHTGLCIRDASFTFRSIINNSPNVRRLSVWVPLNQDIIFAAST